MMKMMIDYLFTFNKFNNNIICKNLNNQYFQQNFLLNRMQFNVVVQKFMINTLWGISALMGSSVIYNLYKMV